MPKFWPIALLSVLNSKYKIRVQMEQERDRASHPPSSRRIAADDIRDNRPSIWASRPSRTIFHRSWTYQASSRYVFLLDAKLIGIANGCRVRMNVQNRKSHILKSQLLLSFILPLTKYLQHRVHVNNPSTAIRKMEGCLVSYMSCSISRTR